MHRMVTDIFSWCGAGYRRQASLEGGEEDLSRTDHTRLEVNVEVRSGRVKLHQASRSHHLRNEEHNGEQTGIRRCG